MLHPTWLASHCITLEVAANLFVMIDRRMELAPEKAARTVERTAERVGRNTRIVTAGINPLPGAPPQPVRTPTRRPDPA